MDGVLGNFSFGIYSSVSNTLFLNIFVSFFFFIFEPPTMKFAISEQVWCIHLIGQFYSRNNLKAKTFSLLVVDGFRNKTFSMVSFYYMHLDWYHFP